MDNDTSVRTCRAVGACITAWAPEALAEPWDNVGWMFGNPDAPLTGMLVALDLTEASLAQARALGFNLVVTHHPPVFSSMRAVTADTWEGRMAGLCWTSGIAVFSAHTNFDAAPGGLCDILAKTLSLREVFPFPGPGSIGLGGRGRYGLFPEPMDAGRLCRFLETRLGGHALRLVGPAPEAIVTAVVQNGAYDRDLLPALVARRPDVVVTGDVKYHDALALAEAGLFVVDAGHQATELAFCGAIARHVSEAFPDLPVQVAREAPVYRAP